MALSIEQTNSYVSKYIILGWWAGLGWYAYNAGISELSMIWWLVLIFAGMFVGSIGIGIPLAILFGLLTRAVFGDANASSSLFAWGAVIGPIIAFFCAEPSINLLKSWVT